VAPIAAATYQSLVPGALKLAGSAESRPSAWTSIRELPGQFEGLRQSSRAFPADLRFSNVDARAGAQPQTILFGGLIDPRLRLLRPIPLKVSREAERTTVEWIEADTAASGATLTSAMEKFGARLRSIFHELTERHSLDPERARILEVLTQHISCRPA
jgi:hypothetical protein